MGKRDWILSNLKNSRQYQMGMWQGRVDKARGLSYAEKLVDAEDVSSHNMGYHVGYSEYESNRRGWAQTVRDAFDAAYLK